MIQRKYKLLTIWCISVLLLTLAGCGCHRKHIDIHCKSLHKYHSIHTIVDWTTLEKKTLDSIQYRDYLLSYSNTSDSLVISGLAFLERCYWFDKGLILVVDIDSTLYEVITIVDPHSKEAKSIVAGRYYWMKIKPYFRRSKEPMYIGKLEKYIYYNHYVIMPVYSFSDGNNMIFIHDNEICTTDILEIKPVKQSRKIYKKHRQ